MSELPPPPIPGSTTPERAPAAVPAPVPVMLLDPPPRPGELTLPWRVGTAICWIGVVLALSAVWSASVQLGLSTWWLGPRGEQQPRVVQLSPFIAPVLMVLGTINNVRRLGWFGLGAATVIGVIGLVDIGRVGSIAATELAIAGAAAVISIASFTGTYQKPRAADQSATDASGTVTRD